MNNPWKGLSCYEESDNGHYLFCGRDKYIKELLSLVKENLCITLYGRTGIGKTSLLKAGLSPMLRKDRYLPIIIRLSDFDYSAPKDFADIIIQQIKNKVVRTVKNAHSTPIVSEIDYLWSFFATHHFYDSEGQEVFPTIVLDQFEECFIKNSDTKRIELLIKQIYSLIDDNKLYPDGYHDITNFRIILSIREDDLFRLEDCIDKLGLSEFKYNRYRLVSLTSKEAEEIITIPGDKILPKDKVARKEIVDHIIQSVRDDEDNNMSTLMLSLICCQLYETALTDSDHPLITLDIVNKTGKNLLKDFYLGVISNHTTMVDRFYIEDHLVDENGRRNAINKEVLEKHCPSWKILTAGSNRILHEINGKVEFVHDMLAQAVFAIREKRNEEIKIAQITEQKIAAAKRNRHRIIAFSFIMAIIVAIAGLFAWQSIELKERSKKIVRIQARFIGEKATSIASKDSYTASLLALELLDNYPYTVEAERALRIASNKKNAIFIGHSDITTSACFSPDNRKIASSSRDGSIIIWDSNSGSRLFELTLSSLSSERVFDISYSPDGLHIAAAYGDGNIRIWNTNTYQLEKELEVREFPAHTVSYSNNGRYIASGCSCDVILWDAQNGQMIFQFVGHRDYVEDVSFNKDDKYIISASADRTIKKWNIAEQKEEKTITSTSGYVMSVSCSPNGKLIAAGYEDGSIKIWDFSTYKLVNTLIGHDRLVRSVSFSNDGKYIVSASDDRTIRIWKTDDGIEIKKLEGHTDRITSAKFNIGGNLIVSASQDRSIRLWDISDDNKYTKLSKKNSYSFLYAEYNHQGNMIIGTDVNGHIFVWDASDGSMIRCYHGLSDEIYCASFSPSDKYIVAGSYNHAIGVWDINESEPLTLFDGHDAAVTRVFFSPDEKFISSSSWDNNIRVWKCNGGIIDTSYVLKGHTDNVFSLSYSPDGKHIVSASADSTIRVWNIKKQQKEPYTIKQDDYVIFACYSSDGKRIVSSSKDGTIRVWNAFNGKEELCIKQHDRICTASFSPDGKYIVSAADGGIVSVWDSQTGDKIEAYDYLTNVNHRVANSAFFNPQGNQIVAAYNDGCIRIWEFESLEKLIDRTRKRLGDRKLSKDERIEYFLE